MNATRRWEEQLQDDEPSEEAKESDASDSKVTQPSQRRTLRATSESSRSRHPRASQRRPASRTRSGRNRAVRTEVTTIRKTRTVRTTKTEIVRRSYAGDAEEADSRAHSKRGSSSHRKRKRTSSSSRGRSERKQAREVDRTDGCSSPEEDEDERAAQHDDESQPAADEDDNDDGEAEIETAEADQDSDSRGGSREQRLSTSQWSAADSRNQWSSAVVCMECGENAVGSFRGSGFCSSLCKQWVWHKRFLSDMYRSMYPRWSEQYDQYYQPMHNLPLYPLTSGLTCCQLPFAFLASESLDPSLPIVRDYLAYQQRLNPVVRLRPSSIHGTGLFAAKRITANTRILIIFGLLFPRYQFLDERDHLLPAARHMDRLLDVDALDTGEVSLILSISRACAAGYINSVRDTVGRRQNVRFECNERVRRAWSGEGWVPSGLMIVRSVCDIETGEELLENYPV